MTSTQITSDRGRLEWMDTLRGIAIVLVIVWHAPGLLALAGWDVPPALIRVNNFFLPYRMPTLMFLSGLLLARSLGKGLPRYYLGKLQLVVWPYLIWAALHIVQFGVGHPIWDPRAFISTGYLWFLFFLALYYAIAPLVVLLPVWIAPVAFWAAALAVPPGPEHNFLFYAGFFFIGHAATRRPRVLEALISRLWVVILLTVAAASFGLVSMQFDVNMQPLLVPFSLAGIAAAIAWVKKTDGLELAQPLQFAGRNSIVYYVAHFPIMVVVVQVMPDDASPDPTSIAIWMLLIALIGCTLLALGRDTVPLRYLFEAPGTRWLAARRRSRIRAGAESTTQA